MLPLLIDQESYLLFLWLQKKFSEANLIWNEKKKHKSSYKIIPLCIFVESAAVFVYKYDFQIIVDNHTFFITTVEFHIITWWPILQKSIIMHYTIWNFL